MKRLSKVSSSKARAAAAAAMTEHSYEDVDEETTAQKAKFASLYDDDDDEDVDEDEGEDDDDGDGLRQNPRKTWRISASKNGDNHQVQEKRKQQELQQQRKFVCSKCGKGFQSSKAMCGHMACHSEKEKASSNVVARQKQLVMDSQSDTESGAKNPRRRSRRTRYKHHNSVVADSSKGKKVDAFHNHQQQQHNYNNCSSGASGVEHEQEEVAFCLMMLSRDAGNWGGLNSVGDSSDNNSVVLEARSINTKLKNKDSLRSFGFDADEGVKKCGSRKVKTLDNSESGYVGNRAENAAADVKIKNLRKRKLDEESKPEPHMNIKKLKSVNNGGLKSESCGDGEWYRQIERPEMESYRTVNESYSAGYNVGNRYSNAEMYSRFEDKALVDSQSHQAFDPNPNAAAKHQSFETDQTRKGKAILEHNSGNVGGSWKKGSKHECPICFKVFRSGQALGGHRRVHLAEGTEAIKCDEVAANIKPNGAQMHDFIDLNLPAPTEDEEEASESMASYGRFQAHHQT